MNIDISDCSFDKLPFSNLFKSYVHSFDELAQFFEVSPFADDKVQEKAAQIDLPVDKTPLIEALKQYHKVLGIQSLQEKALRKFDNENALVIITGQQLGIYGGPLYTIYKTMTAILLAKKWEKKLDRPVIPVFWMADEDHDYEEIAWVGISGNQDFKTYRLPDEEVDKPVAIRQIHSSIEKISQELKEELIETDFSDDLWALLDGCYHPEVLHRKAFAELIASVFGETDLLIAGSNFADIKKMLIKPLKKSVSEADAVYRALEQKSSSLDDIFHRQVVVQKSNLFFIDDQGRRLKLQFEGDTWKCDAGKWSSNDLLDLIEEKPERFSPNVFLRPILQDKLFPTMGYVAGPGEIAYYAQMKELYPEFDLKMPVIFPRLSITLLESAISRILDKLPFKFYDYNERVEDLEKEYIETTDKTDLEALFSRWKDKIENVSEDPRKEISAIDPTLDGTVGKTVAQFGNELDKLKGKVYRSVKQQEETQIRRIEKIKTNLFPDGVLQERMLSPIYVMNKYGPDIWNTLLEAFESEEFSLDRHYIVDL